MGEGSDVVGRRWILAAMYTKTEITKMEIQLLLLQQSIRTLKVYQKKLICARNYRRPGIKMLRYSFKICTSLMSNKCKSLGKKL